MNRNATHEMLLCDDSIGVRARDDLQSPARLCHKVNNKLVPIVTYAELGERLCQDPKVQPYWGIIRKAAYDLREMFELMADPCART